MLFFERIALKGGAIIRDALPLLNGYRLLVVGGTKEDRARFGTAPRVISLDRVADTRQLYWAADVFVFGSNRKEAFGYVIVEALACGVPVAASDIPIVHEICGNSESVITFPVGDASALAQAVKTAFGSDSTAARKRVVEQFSLPRWTEEILRLYYVA